MSENPMISIVVPVYNVEKHLKRCISSLLAQDYPSLEIILVDDGSTDTSGAICDTLANEDSRIAVYHKENGGLSDARNFGLDMAKGEYILFVDSDDYILENSCSYLANDAISSNADMVIANAAPIAPIPLMAERDSCVKESFLYHKPYSGEEYLVGCLKKSGFRVEVWRSLYSARFLRENGLSFGNGLLHEDELFTPLALLSAKCVVLSDLPFYIYDNSRSTSIMNSKKLDAKKAADKLCIYNTLWDEYKSIESKTLRKWLYDDWCVKYLCTVTKHKLLSQPKFKPERMKVLRSAYKPKRKIKAFVFAVSPRLYCKIFK